MKGSRLALVWLSAGSCALALVLAACGGSSATPGVSGGTTATGNASPVGLSKCMRSHGVPNFPDPTNGSGGEGFNGIEMSIGGPASLRVDGITFSGPALRDAEKACKAFLPGGGSPPPPLTASQKQALIANAECMRKHGVPSFPDPTFPAGRGARIQIQPTAGVNPQSPAFRQAVAACGGSGGRLRLP